MNKRYIFHAFGNEGIISRAFFYAFFLIILLMLPTQRIRASVESDLLPEGRTFVPLREGERNPFSQQLELQQPTAIAEVESEESRLRRIIDGIKIGGVSTSKNDHRVLLGSLILKAGDTLPPLIEDQQEIIHIVSVDSSEVRLSFLDKDVEAQVRQIVLPIKMSPEVNQFLYGEAFERLAIGADGKTNSEDISLKGVQDFLKGSQEAELQNLTDRKVEMMGVLKNAAESQKEK